MSPRKHKLSVSIEEDYCLLGIVSDDPDYKLCWSMNERLKFSLTKTDDLVLFNRKLNGEQEFPIFHFHDESTMITYRIIRNRIDSGYYLSGLKNIDFLLHIQGEIYSDSIKELISRLGSIDSVRMCVPVNLSKIKERDRLQLW